jgi:large repetitive protein
MIMRKLALAAATALVFDIATSASLNSSDTARQPKSVSYDAYFSSLSQDRKSGVSVRAKSAAAHERLSKRLAPSLAGYESHVDSDMGAATFVWADASERGAVVPKTAQALKSGASVDQKAREFLKRNMTAMRLTRTAVDDARLFDLHDTGRGPLIARYRQTVSGIEVFNRQLAVLMDRQLRPVAASGYFASVAQAADSARMGSGNKRAASTAAAGLQFSLSATEAIAAGFKDLGGTIAPAALKAQGSSGPFMRFAPPALASGALKLTGAQHAKQVLYPASGESGDQLLPAYHVVIAAESADGTLQKNFGYVIDAATGRVLVRKDLVADAAFSYRAYADSQGVPHDGPLGNAQAPDTVGPAGPFARVPGTQALITLNSGPISTADPWLPAGGTETRGNNVDAYLDLDGFSDEFGNDGPNDGFTPDSTDLRADVTAPGVFDYFHAPDTDPTTLSARKAAVVNLFYLNNYFHDWWYDHGFDEAAGNAQVDNLGRGGAAGDPIHAEGQDASGTDNANMATPPDGISPRMQMYIFTPPVQGVLEVQSFQAMKFGQALFGPQSFEVTSNLVPYQQGLGDDEEDDDDEGNAISIGNGCRAASNGAALTGNIALLHTGSCDYVVKARNAQAAGAVAVIMITADKRITLTGADPSIVIPALSVSVDDGEQIKLALRGGPLVTHVRRDYVAPRDGTMDNSIIAHEWFHYVSNRLVGDGMGLVNQQGAAMGEGWSDFSSLLLTVRPEDRAAAGNDEWQAPYSVASYVLDNRYFGIRRYPYSTSFNVNPLTYRHTEWNIILPDTAPINGPRDGFDNSEVHGAGEVWCNALWEVYAALLNDPRYSFEEAQSRMMDYIIAGLKLTPVAPTFLEARDALLAAALASDVEDFKLMAKAFAKRGMGVGAVAAERYDTLHLNTVESFVAFAGALRVESTALNFHYEDGRRGWIDDDGVLDPGETALLSVTLRNEGTADLTQPFKARLSSDADLDFPEGAEITFPALKIGESGTVSVPVKLVSASAMAQVVELRLEFAEQGASVIEPKPITTTLVVNYDLKPGQRSFEDGEQPQAMLKDWGRSIDGGVWAVQPAAERNFQPSHDWDQYFGTGGVWWGQDPSEPTDSKLESPEVLVGNDDFAVSFEHYFGFEVAGLIEYNGEIITVGWDGGVMEISVDGGAWQDVIEAGGQFDTNVGNGYNGRTIAFNPINGAENWRPSFVETNYFYSPRIPEPMLLNFGKQLAGKKVRVRFRIATDTIGGSDGWVIDNLQFLGATTVPFSNVVAEDGVMANRPPHLSVPASGSFDEADASGVRTVIGLTASVTDADGTGGHVYRWEQISGPVVAINNPAQLGTSFIAPDVSSDQPLSFKLTLRDGDYQESATTTITVRARATTAPATPSKGGGGAVNPLLLLILAAGLLARLARTHRIVRAKFARAASENLAATYTHESALSSTIVRGKFACGRCENAATVCAFGSGLHTRVTVAGTTGARRTLAAFLLGMIALLPSLASASIRGDAAVAQGIARQPLYFERNVGQGPAEAKYIARGPGYALFLKSNEAVLGLQRGGKRGFAQSAVVRASLVGGSEQARVAASEPLTGRSNYFIGDDPATWRRDVQRFGKVRYAEVYPGVDLVYYGNQRSLEYDFIVAPGADYKQIRMRYAGIHSVKPEAGGALRLATRDGAITLQPPVTYQVVNGRRVPVHSRYRTVRTQQGWEVRFDVGRYDRERDLVIDPVLVYGSYFGGNQDDFPGGIAVDRQGNIYIAGYTWSLDFPLSEGAFQTRFAAPDPEQENVYDAFVAKLSPDGSELLYSTFLGGEYGDTIDDIAVDSDGNAYVVGSTCSFRFPLKNPFQTAPATITCSGFLSKLNPTGSDLTFSTYFGPYSQNAYVEITGVAVDVTRKITIVGATDATDLPILNAIQPVFHTDPEPDQPWQQPDGFIAKFTADGRALVFSTYLGGIDREEHLRVATDAIGSQIYVTGETQSKDFPLVNPAQPELADSGASNHIYRDLFITKLKGDGSAIEFSTYYGGTHDEQVGGIGFDAAGNVYVGAMSSSWLSLPVLNSYREKCDPFGDALLLKYTASGELVYANLFGGDTAGRFGASDIGDPVNDIAVSPDGSVYVLGTTFIANFPVIDPPAGMSVDRNTVDAYLVKFGPVNNGHPTKPPFIYSTRVGGTDIDGGRSIAFAPNGDLMLLGATFSSDMPVINAFQQEFAGGTYAGDLFLLRVSNASPSSDEFAFEAAAMSAKEGDTLEVKVYRTGTAGGIVSLNFASANGTAQADKDFQSVAGHLDWAATDFEPKTISVKLMNDSAYAAGRTFDLVLSDLTATTAHAKLGQASKLTVTIQDDESPPSQSPPPSGGAGGGGNGGGGALGFGWSALAGLLLMRRRIIAALQTPGESRCIAMDSRRSQPCCSRHAARSLASTELAGSPNSSTRTA